MKPLIIYHGDCNDGFGAALAAYLYYGENAQYYAGMYDGEIPDVIDRDVLIFDYHFKRNILEEMHAKAKSLILKEHHFSAMKILTKMPYAHFDMNKSGAVLAWEHFFKEPIPEMFQWIQDRDLWENKHPESQAFYFYINSLPYDFKHWEKTYEQLKIKNERTKILELGRQILKFYNSQMELIIKHYAQKIKLNENEGWIINTNRLFATEVGSELAKRTHSFALIWSVTSKNTVSVSVRSFNNNQAIEIAEKMGGGGHGNAAKFSKNN